ncbi:MAG: C39 family peptidase [Pseudomonadota bacterium]
MLELPDKRHFPAHRVLFFCILLACPSVQAETPHPLLQNNQYFDAQAVSTPAGDTLIRTIINGPPSPPPGFELQRTVVSSLPKPDIQAGINILNTPAFSWSFGCSATSAAMIAGYYDRTGYNNMYTGPTNGGIMPLDNSSWPSWTDSYGDTRAQCPLSATHNGLDNRTTRGHVDDYWIGYGASGPDPWSTNGWLEHTKGECTADYMNTNQWVNPVDGWNTDGSTVFYHYADSQKFNCADYVTFPYDTRGDLGIKKFYESRGYTVTECYTQHTDNSVTGGFSFADYKAEIDAGRPVMFHVTGHTMVGVGYDDSSNLMYIHDTWDYSTHTMTWGGSYSGMTQYAVTIVKLTPNSSTLTINSLGAAGVGITGNPATYSGITNYSKPGITSGTTIILTAPATANNLPFTGWHGCNSTVDKDCTVTMTTDKIVTARYGSQNSFPWIIFVPAILNKP